MAAPEKYQSPPPDARIGILGGSFNPVHVGHLRLAIEARERLGLDRVDLVPCNDPPHKDSSHLLDFSLRLSLCETAVQGLDGLAVNNLEGCRQGLSYTRDTLREYHGRVDRSRLHFIMGAADLYTLPQWKGGLGLLRMAVFTLMPRYGQDHDAISAFLEAHSRDLGRAEALPRSELPQGASAAWRLPDQADQGQDGPESIIIYIDAPALDISSSQIRELWLKKRSPDFLMPEAVLAQLKSREQDLAQAWG